MQHDFRGMRETLDSALAKIKPCEHQAAVDEIDEVLAEEPHYCVSCHGRITQAQHDTLEGHCPGCYLDFRTGQRQQEAYDRFVKRDPYLGNGTTEDRRRAFRGENTAKTGMF